LDLEACLDLEETEEEEIVRTWETKEKGQLVFLINEDEDEDNNLNVNYIKGMHEVMDTSDEKVHMYHEPLKIDK
ncbi:hypothetical protein KI387_016488, partial [Taxus chinensis]